MNCSTFSDTNYPAFVKVGSTGTINGSPNRTIETYVRLTPNYGGFGAAILAVNGTTITNNFTVNGNSGNDGDIYILNGNFRVTNGMTLYGNVYVPAGTITFANNSTVKGSIWARDTVTVKTPRSSRGPPSRRRATSRGRASSTTTPRLRATWSPPTSRSGAP